MHISQEYLSEPQNRYLIASSRELVWRVIEQIRDKAGDDNWHIVIINGMTGWYIIQVSRLLRYIRDNLDAANWPLDRIPLSHAVSVDVDEMSTQDARELAERQPDKVVAVTSNGGMNLLGVIYEGRLRSGAKLKINEFPFTTTRLDWIEVSTPTQWTDSHVPQDSSPPHPFEAFPLLIAPPNVPPEAQFEVIVGFRAASDDNPDRITPMKFEDVTDESFALVILVTDGAEVLGEARQSLALSLSARVTFICRAKPSVVWITISVQYWHNGQMSGVAKCTIAVASPNVYPQPSAPPTRPNRYRVSLATAATQTDLQVTIAKTRDGQLHWTFISPYPQQNIGPVVTELAEAREFAGSILSDLRTQRFTGLFAARILENIGQDIANIMPHEFFDALENLYSDIGSPPTVLLYTDEQYVPWELALLPNRLDASLPGFLGVQTIISRWLLDDNVIYPPPTALNIERISAVAGKYKVLADIRATRAERAMLVKHHNAVAVNATRASLEPLVEPSLDGHLIHFAVHGVSDVRANAEALLLADDTSLVARALSGSHTYGHKPPFVFVFLNACQVGTAGSAFGQAAGFPGDLVRGGVSGFIAPLWDVGDTDGLSFATAFYDEVLNNKKSVAETLRNQRLKYVRTGHTTPLAYIYYGHPDLHLKVKKARPHDH